MAKVAAVNVSVDRDSVAGQLNGEDANCSSLDICLKTKMQMFSGDDLICEFPKPPITICSISLPCHSDIQNPNLLRSSIETRLSCPSRCPELLCAADLLLAPTQILDEQHQVCIVDLVAERVASLAALPTVQNSNSNSMMFHFVAHVEIVNVVTSIAPELGLIFKRDFKKFNAIDELKKQATFQVQVSSSSCSSSGNQDQDDDQLAVGDCSICLQDLYASGIDLIRLPNCAHVFHQKCILPWLKNSDLCPLCRNLCLQ